jgi:hypothetical protein
VSLILEALKKLEREKSGPDRGFLVLGAQPDRPRRRGWLAVMGLTALAALAGAALWLGGPASAPAPQPVSPDLPAAVAERSPPPAAPAATPPFVVREGDPGATSDEPARPRAESRTLDRAATPEPEERPRPEPSAQVPGPPFRLEAISRRDGEPVAILNGRLVREGDRLGAARIVRIGELEVEIEVNGTRSVLAF